MELSKEIQELVKEYNINSKANNMLYKDEEVAIMMKTKYNLDRFDFVEKCNSISVKLIPLITPLHGKKVTVNGRNGVVKGVIEHLPTRVYTNITGEKRTTDNTVSFRTYKDDSEGIALWVNTGDKFTTHLYNVEDMI